MRTWASSMGPVAMIVLKRTVQLARGRARWRFLQRANMVPDALDSRYIADLRIQSMCESLCPRSRNKIWSRSPAAYAGQTFRTGINPSWDSVWVYSSVQLLFLDGIRVSSLFRRNADKTSRSLTLDDLSPTLTLTSATLYTVPHVLYDTPMQL